MPIKIKKSNRCGHPELRKLDHRQAAITEARIRLDEMTYDPCHMKRR